MDDAVLKLVDDVLANAPAALREACSCRGILAGLETVGAFDVPTLRTLLEQDYAEVKQSISGAALPAFVRGGDGKFLPKNSRASIRNRW